MYFEVDSANIIVKMANSEDALGHLQTVLAGVEGIKYLSYTRHGTAEVKMNNRNGSDVLQLLRADTGIGYTWYALLPIKDTVEKAPLIPTGRILIELKPGQDMYELLAQSSVNYRNVEKQFMNRYRFVPGNIDEVFAIANLLHEKEGVVWCYPEFWTASLFYPSTM